MTDAERNALLDRIIMDIEKASRTHYGPSGLGMKRAIDIVRSYKIEAVRLAFPFAVGSPDKRIEEGE